MKTVFSVLPSTAVMAQAQLTLLDKSEMYSRSDERNCIKSNIKKDGIRSIYCASCKKWMTEFYVSRHLQSKFHFTKKHFKKGNSKNTKTVRRKTEDANSSKPEKELECEQDGIQGGKVSTCENVFVEGCGEFENSLTFTTDTPNQVKHQLFEQEPKHYTFEEIQRNQLDLFGIMDNWNWDENMDNENGANEFYESAGEIQPTEFSTQCYESVPLNDGNGFSQNAGQPQPKQYAVQNDWNMTILPITVVSDVFGTRQKVY